MLAAGLGSRLRPLTTRLPKPLVPVCGRPCVEVLLEWLVEQGVTEIALNTHHLPAALRQALGDGSHLGARLVWQHEDALLDGMGTLKSFEWFFGSEPALVVNGDVVCDLPLAPALAEHRRRGALMTLLTVARHGPMIHPVVWDDAGWLRGIRRTGLDDPRGRHWGVFTGLHVVEPVVWQQYIPPGRRYHLTTELLPQMLAAGQPVACHLAAGLWADIGDYASLAAAWRAILATRSDRYLRGAQEIAPGVWMRGQARVAGEICPPVYLEEGAVVSPGATLGPYAALLAGQVLRAGEHLAYDLRGL
ncbi:MAG: NDP-sugar synthase [Armatimonadetes bacterium]|nr:NDP-sugar synthase [Armatimonadota bacterium]